MDLLPTTEAVTALVSYAQPLPMTTAEAAAIVQRNIESATRIFVRPAAALPGANEDDFRVHIEWLGLMRSMLTGPSAERAQRVVETDLANAYPHLAAAFRLARAEAAEAILHHRDAAEEQLDLLRARRRLQDEGVDPWDPANREHLEDVWDELMAERSRRDPEPSCLLDDALDGLQS